jgi:hypothetical protein
LFAAERDAADRVPERPDVDLVAGADLAVVDFALADLPVASLDVVDFDFVDLAVAVDLDPFGDLDVAVTEDRADVGRVALEEPLAPVDAPDLVAFEDFLAAVLDLAPVALELVCAGANAASTPQPAASKAAGTKMVKACKELSLAGKPRRGALLI